MENINKDFKNENSIDKRVQDYINGINQLSKDTGIEIISFDWSSAILQTPEGKLYALDKNEDKDVIQYHGRSLNEDEKRDYIAELFERVVIREKQMKFTELITAILDEYNDKLQKHYPQLYKKMKNPKAYQYDTWFNVLYDMYLDLLWQLKMRDIDPKLVAKHFKEDDMKKLFFI